MGFWSWLTAGYPDPTPTPETRTTPATPDPPDVVLPPRPVDVPVSDGQILRTVAVYRAVQLLTIATAQLSVDVWRGRELIERPSLVKRPDIKLRDLAAFTKRTVASLALTGNAYWLVTRNARNEASNLEVLNPHECVPHPDGTLAVAGREHRLQPHEFQHLGLLWVPGESRALGPIQAARVELAGALKTTRYGSEVHDTGSVPDGVLKTDQVLSADQAAAYKEQWMRRGPHEVAVLGQGMDYRPILLAPKDAQFIESRQFDTTAIARLFGIPAHLFLAAVEGNSMTYVNMAQSDMSFMRWTVSAYVNELEQALTAVLPSTQTAKFNLDAVLRPDARTRYEAHEIAIRSGFLTVNEVREIENLPPLPTQKITAPKGVAING